MRTYVIILVHADTHKVWAHRPRVSTTVLTRKNSHFSCAPDGIRTSVLWILSPTLQQLSHPVTASLHHPVTRHLVTLSPSHPATTSPHMYGHHVTPSPHHPITPSPHHPITPSPSHPTCMDPGRSSRRCQGIGGFLWVLRVAPSPSATFKIKIDSKFCSS